MKIGLRLIALSSMLLAMTGCQRMDRFDNVGMMESFNGMTRVTPGIGRDSMSDVVTVGLMTINSDGENVIIADAKGEAFSLKEMLFKGATESDMSLLEEMLAEKGIKKEDNLEFSGFKGVVDPANPKVVTINDFASKTNGIETLNLKADGYARLDKKNDMYLDSTINIYIHLKDLEEILPILADELLYGNDQVPLSEIKDKNTKIYVARFKFTGVSLTGFI